MSLEVDTAIVLAGGPSTRLRPLTDNLPKGMVEVNGKPLLQWIVEWLREKEVKNIIFGVAYLREKIIDYFGNGEKFGVNIGYSLHSVEGGTSEGFLNAINRFVKQDVFLAMNGDQITDLNLGRLIAFHMKHNPVATIAVSSPRCPYGHVRIDREGCVSGFVEKPVCQRASCNIGIYVFNRQITHYLPKRGDIEKTTFPRLAKSRLLRAYPFRGFFVTINTQRDLVMAEEELRRRFG